VVNRKGSQQKGFVRANNKHTPCMPADEIFTAIYQTVECSIFNTTPQCCQQKQQHNCSLMHFYWIQWAANGGSINVIN